MNVSLSSYLIIFSSITIFVAPRDYIKNVIVQTEGFSSSVYKDGIVANKQNYSIGFGSSAGLGSPTKYKISKPEALKLVDRELEDYYGLAVKDFPNIKEVNKLNAIALLYFKVGKYVFKLKPEDSRFANNNKLYQLIKSGSTDKQLLRKHWINTKNKYKSQIFSRNCEVELYFKY